MSLPECILAGIAGRSARHFFPAVRGVLRIEEAQATAGDHALGAWVPPRQQAARGAEAVAMAVGYGGTEPQLAAAAATRPSVVETFRAWLGDRCWEDAVPLCKGVPSFTFLLSTSLGRAATNTRARAPAATPLYTRCRANNPNGT